MSTVIYYFTGTGNSLQVAKDLAAELEEAELQAIPRVLRGEQAQKADAIGLVFPVYAWGAPQIVVDFINRFTLQKVMYIFALVTCGGAPGGTLLEVDKLLNKKGLSLSAGFYVKQPDNYIIWSGADSDEKQREVIRRSKERVLKIAEIVKEKKICEPEKNGYLYNLMGGIIHKLFRANAGKQARNFWVNDSCCRCQTCIAICPRNNITIQEHKPVWGDECEQCLACIQWCPAQAIQYKKKTLKRKRYRHPDIEVKELLSH